MVYFKKYFNLKIVSVSVIILFCFNIAIYGMELSNKDSLRKSLDFNNQQEVVSRYLQSELGLATREGISLFIKKKEKIIQNEEKELRLEQAKSEDKDAKKIETLQESIKKAQNAIGEVETRVKAQNELALIPLNQAIWRLKENGYEDVAKILIDLYPAVLPYLIKGQDESPVHHITHVVNFMSEILVDEAAKGNVSREDLKRGIVGALLHDIGVGDATLPKITENMVKDEKDPKEKEILRDSAIKSRKEHMEKGAAISRTILEGYNEASERDVFYSSDIEAILRIVGEHDNSKIPLIMVLEKYDNVGIPETASREIKKCLITNTKEDWLMQLHWEADALWMLSRDGLLVDLKRQKEEDNSRSRLNKLNYNLSLHREIVSKCYQKVFDTAELKKFGFHNNLLYRSSIGYRIAKRLAAENEAHVFNLFDFMEAQIAMNVTVNYADDAKIFYEAVKNIILGDTRELNKIGYKELDKKMRKLAAKVENFVTGRELATNYSLWNITEDHGKLFSFKQFVLTYKILDRALEAIGESSYEESQKSELKTMINYFFYAALPEFIDGRKGNPVHHNVQALENMLHIVLAEKPKDYEFFRQAVVLALLHDVGNSRTDGVKVKSSQLKALKENVKSAKDEAEKKSLEQELRKTFNDAENYRRSHMIAGAEMVRDLLVDYHLYVGKVIFEPKTIDAICDVVERHDNPSMAAYQKEILGKVDIALLFTPTDELALYLREADRVWMVSPEGVEKDLMDEAGKGEGPVKKLDYNTEAHRKEYGLYKENISDEAKLVAYGFKDKTLYHSDGGYSLYKDFIQKVNKILYYQNAIKTNL